MAILDKIVRASQLEPRQQLVNKSVMQKDISDGDLMLDTPTGIINVDDVKYVTKVVFDEETGLLATKTELANKLDAGEYVGTAQDLKLEIDGKLNRNEVPQNLPSDLFRDGGYIGTAQSLKDEIDMKASVSSIPTDVMQTGGYAGSGQDLKNEIDSKITIDQVPSLPTDLMRTGGYIGTGQDLKIEIDTKITIADIPDLPSDLFRDGGYVGTAQTLKDEIDTKITVSDIPELPADLFRDGGYIGTAQSLKDEIDTKITISDIPELPTDIVRSGGYVGTAKTLKDEIDTKITIDQVPELPTDIMKTGAYVGTGQDLKNEIDLKLNVLDLPNNLPADIMRDGGYVGTAKTLKEDIDTKLNISDAHRKYYTAFPTLDLNQLVEPGVYSTIPTEGWLNYPADAIDIAGSRMYLEIVGFPDGAIKQMLYNANGHYHFARSRQPDLTWTEWCTTFNNKNTPLDKNQIGYTKMPNGLIIQWGEIPAIGGDVALVALPIAMSNSAFSPVFFNIVPGTGWDTAPLLGYAQGGQIHINRSYLGQSSGNVIKWCVIGW